METQFDALITTVLTLEEIQSQYPQEWVLIFCPELDEDLNVIRGQVLAHSTDRDEIYSKLPLRKGKPVAIEYTGLIPNDLAAIL